MYFDLCNALRSFGSTGTMPKGGCGPEIDALTDEQAPAPPGDDAAKLPNISPQLMLRQRDDAGAR